MACHPKLKFHQSLRWKCHHADKIFINEFRWRVSFCQFPMQTLMKMPSIWLHCHLSDWIIMKNFSLTHWGRVTHIFVSKLTTIGSDNGLSPGRRHVIIWANGGILLIEHLGTNFSEILIGIQTFSLKKMHLKMSSAKWHPFCLGLNVLTVVKFHLSTISKLSV